jgi:hypothetical protein
MPMKTVLLWCLMSVVGALALGAGPPAFDDYFLDRTLRIDYFQTGDADEIIVSIDQVYEQGVWAGNPHGLIDNLNRGSYYVKVVDLNTNRTIYTRGFSNISAEYRTTDEAKQGVKKTFHHSVLIPRPRRPFLFVLEGRDRTNLLVPIYTIRMDPKDHNIIRDPPNPDDRVAAIQTNGPAHDKVDLVFVAEGYTAGQWEKFCGDAKRFTEVIFDVEPFKTHRSRFNVAGVFRASAQSGVDEPTRGSFKKTVLSASYNALDTARYLLVDDNRTLRDVAQVSPYDYLIVLVNNPSYGGGGIYNDYTIFTADDRRSEGILMHEFGHGFADLADEYVGGVAYNDFYPPGVEPCPPNITALLDPGDVKWKHLLSPGIPIPTPTGEDEIAELREKIGTTRTEFAAQIERLERAGANTGELDEARARHNASLAAWERRIREIREHYESLYTGKIGVFEGAGYSAKGLYRSEIHVGMFRNGTYGPVSEEGIQGIIEHLSR